MRGALPEGFVRVDRAGLTLVAEASRLGALVAAGLDRPERWTEAIANGSAGRGGRGALGRIVLAGEEAWIVKRLRRGGLLRGIWRDRHLGTGRLIRNVTVPALARSRGIATPAVRALAIRSGPPGLWRGWLALEALDGEDLLTSARRDPTGFPGRLARAMPAVRAAHDAGLRHPDLNLSNLFLARDGTVHLLDLDGATVDDRPASPTRRVVELLRLERSWRRHAVDAAPDGVDPATFLVHAYAAGDERLRRSLIRMGGLGRGWLALRGASWPGARGRT